MAVNFASSIAVPIVGLKIRLTFTATTGNHVRVWCSAAPAGSKLREKLDKDKASRSHLFDLDSGESTDYQFDAAGAYSLVVGEIQLGSTYGGSYQYAADSAPSELLIGEESLTLHIANGLKATLGIAGDTAELSLYAADADICETLLGVHGVASPIIQKAKSAKAKTAAAAATVQSALAALVGVSATFALGDLSAAANDWIDKFNNHASNGTFHALADSDNQISAAFKSPTSPEGLKRTLAAMLKALSAHIRNDSVVSPSGTGTHPYHSIATLASVDWANVPLFDGTSSISEHVRGLADASRAFDGHRAAASHLNPDNANALAPLSLLVALHAAFLSELANISPTPPVTDNAAKTVLVHGAGFEEI